MAAAESYVVGAGAHHRYRLAGIIRYPIAARLWHENTQERASIKITHVPGASLRSADQVSPRRPAYPLAGTEVGRLRERRRRRSCVTVLLVLHLTHSGAILGLTTAARAR